MDNIVSGGPYFNASADEIALLNATYTDGLWLTNGLQNATNLDVS